MPSLDIKSEIDSHELLNAIDQANRVISNRYDFKGTESKFTLDNEEITLNSHEEFQINQMMPILRESLVKRSIDVKSLDPQKIENWRRHWSEQQKQTKLSLSHTDMAAIHRLEKAGVATFFERDKPFLLDDQKQDLLNVAKALPEDHIGFIEELCARHEIQDAQEYFQTWRNQALNAEV